jgi:hypothetical protein
VFAAGVTLFILLTKQHPYLAEGEPNFAVEVLEERINDNDRPRWTEVIGIEPDVKEVLQRMLQANAFERPHADAAASVLEGILSSR